MMMTPQEEVGVWMAAATALAVFVLIQWGGHALGWW